MKRIGNLKNRIVDYDNLCLAAYKAFKGKRDRQDVQKFLSNFDDNIILIYNQLNQSTVKLGNYNIFQIYEPKERCICAASLMERIVHHALMNICHEIFDRRLIYDTYATRKGKGSHAAIYRLHEKMAKYDYYVKLDVKKYFDSISHEILKDMLVGIFKDEWLQTIFCKIIDSYCINSCKGLPIGNLTSQYFANIYLGGLDHYMKEKQKVPVYVRYMDDIIMLSDSMSQLKCYTAILTDYCKSRLNLTVKPPKFGKCIDGVVFLGYKLSRYKILLSSKSARRFKHKYFVLKNLFEKNYISESVYSTRLYSLLSFVEKAETRNYRHKILFG